MKKVKENNGGCEQETRGERKGQPTRSSFSEALRSRLSNGSLVSENILGMATKEL